VATGNGGELPQLNQLNVLKTVGTEEIGNCSDEN
jgi:hypothetical protein